MLRRLLPACALILCGLLLAPIQAEPEITTAQALEQAVIPPRDRVDLARRLLGVNQVEPPPASAPQRRVGDQRTFWVTNISENRVFQVSATLHGLGDHIALWVENGANIDSRQVQALAKAFDREVYGAVRGLWGSEDTPGIDGDPRVYGLFAYGMGSTIAGYFSSEHTNPVEAVSTSNEHEMFFFNLDAIGTAFDTQMLLSILAHEFQHMIRQHQDLTEQTWLDEGFSKFTELYLGYMDSSAAWSFLNRPQTQVNTWPENASTFPHYGAAMLFVTYFYERYGLDALRALGAHPADGLAAFDAVLRERGEAGADAFFADWVLANFLLHDDLYGYDLLSELSSPPPLAVVTTYPYRQLSVSNQYAADYFVLTNLDGYDSLQIRLAAPETVQLVPAEPVSRAWYSNRADESDTTLTRAFDLTNVRAATLRYRVWYHLEHLWDYGYVMVSADGGETWDILETPHTTGQNPHNNAYGPGYTGESSGWLDETVSLTAYAGQPVLVRFEVITDDATNQPGMLVDDVQIPEVGYSSDFEADSGGWQAAGWIWTDNTLPQNVWVQVVQQVGMDSIIARWSADELPHTLPLEAGVDQVVLAISPFAPVTTEAMPYEIKVTAQ